MCVKNTLGIIPIDLLGHTPKSAGKCIGHTPKSAGTMVVPMMNEFCHRIFFAITAIKSASSTTVDHKKQQVYVFSRSSNL